MKLTPLLRRFVLSSLFLAIFPALLFVQFLPGIGKKYTLAVEPAGIFPDQILFADLNGDGISERIHAVSTRPLNQITVMDADGRFFDQWNLPDRFVTRMSDLFFGDFDRDHKKEIYVFTMQADSLFLNVNEFFEPSGTQLTRIFITKIKLKNGENTSSLAPCGFFDENGDGLDELYFGI